MQVTPETPSKTDPSIRGLLAVGGMALVVMAFGHGMKSMANQPVALLMPNGQSVSSPTVSQVRTALRGDRDCMVDTAAYVVAGNPMKYGAVAPDLAARLAKSRITENREALSAALAIVNLTKANPALATFKGG